MSRSTAAPPRPGTLIAIEVPPAPAAGEPFAAALNHIDRLLATAGALLELVPPPGEDAD